MGAQLFVLLDCTPAASSLMKFFSSATYFHTLRSIILFLWKIEGMAVYWKCEVELHRVERHSLKLQSALYRPHNIRCGGSPLTSAQKKTKAYWFWQKYKWAKHQLEQDL